MRKIKILLVSAVIFCVATNLLAVPVDITFTSDAVIQDGDDYQNVWVYDTPPDITTVDMTGGVVGVLQNYNQSITNMSGGAVAHLLSDEQSTINISGGVVGEALIFSSGGTFNITGGVCGKVAVSYGELNISGGQITYFIDCGKGVVNVYGYGFEYDSPEHSPNLTGFWADGTPFGLDFIAYDRVVLHEIPEPATLLLLGLGSLALRRKRRAK